jgi:ribulose bisphosphate carboxylase small subunit
LKNEITQGAFSFLPDLTDDQILKQVEYALEQWVKEQVSRFST